MQTSNRDNPVENNLNELMQCAHKLTERLPEALQREGQTLNPEQLNVLRNTVVKLQTIIAPY